MAYSGRANIIILLATLLFYKNVLNNTILINKKQIILYMVIIIILGLISGYFRPFMLLISGRELVFDTCSSFMLMFSSIIIYFCTNYFIDGSNTGIFI